MENKENQEGAAASISVASPRVSSVGAASEGGDHPQQHPQAQGYTPTPYSDHLHWGGVQRMLHARSDARSVASSAAADRDDKSIYAEDVGALDAHTEGDERDEDDEEEPEELSLTQVQGELRELPQLRHEPSAVESAFTGISAVGSLADVVDQLADQAVAGELSPRQAAAAIRSATAARGGLADGSVDDGSAGGVGGGSSTAAAVDALDGSESVASLPHRSSIAPSDEGWHGAGGLGGGSSTADMMDSIPLEAEAPPADTLPAAEPVPAEALSAAEPVPAEAPAPPAEQGADAAEPAAAVGEAASEAAAEPAEEGAGGQQAQEQQEAEEEQQVENEEEPALPESKSAHDVAAVLDAAEVPAVEDEPSAAAVAAPAAADDEQRGSSDAPAAATDAAAAAAAAAAGAVPRKPSGSAYRSRLMQQLTASGSEDDITVYSSADLGGGTSAAAGADRLSQAAALQGQQPAAAGDGAAPPAAGSGSGMQPLSIANGGSGGSGVMPTQDTAKALAAINAAATNAPAGEGGEAAAQPELLFPPQWYQTFKGLLYMDGVDSLGRPVVVLNADAVAPNMKASALVFVKAHLEPLVNQGDYVLVFTSRGHARLPSMWIMGAYRSLPRPFRKNVQHVVLVRPSAFLRTVLAFMRPFVSKKAHRKIKQVQSVHDIAAATEGEVTLASLGPAFSAELLADEEKAAAAAAAEAAGGTAPAAGGSTGSSP